MKERDYILARGAKGRERLRILARAMRDGTLRLLEKADIAKGASCLDVGCGGGDVSGLLADLVGPTGQVVGIDQDESVVRIAEQESKAKGIDHLSFNVQSVFDIAPDVCFDLIYCRFLLTHLPDREAAIQHMIGALKPGGLMIFEDIDFSGHFSHPPQAAMTDYMRLYAETAARHGGDAEFGLKLPTFLKSSGLEDVSASISQPAGLDGDIKVVNALTMEGIGPRAVDAGLATPEEVEQIVTDLFAIAADPSVFMSIARVVQAWGRKPS